MPIPKWLVLIAVVVFTPRRKPWLRIIVTLSAESCLFLHFGICWVLQSLNVHDGCWRERIPMADWWNKVLCCLLTSSAKPCPFFPQHCKLLLQSRYRWTCTRRNHQCFVVHIRNYHWRPPSADSITIAIGLMHISYTYPSVGFTFDCSKVGRHVETYSQTDRSNQEGRASITLSLRLLSWWSR